MRFQLLVLFKVFIDGNVGNDVMIRVGDKQSKWTQLSELRMEMVSCCEISKR